LIRIFIDGLCYSHIFCSQRLLRSYFLKQSNLPPKASNDALHIALATIYGLDYLLTWNCKHMANAQIQRKLAQISSELGYNLPVICTPYELMGYEVIGE